MFYAYLLLAVAITADCVMADTAITASVGIAKADCCAIAI